MCPKCQETRLTEIVTTAQTRVAFCGMCSHVWDHTVLLCHCAAVPIAHLHVEPGEALPLCPTCGHRARQSTPT